MKVSPRLTTSILSVTALALVIGAASLQNEVDKRGPAFTTKFVVTNRNIIPEKFVRFSTLGFDNLVADYYWISATQDFVGWNTRDSFYLNYFRNISTLDPKFEYPYLFSIFAIPQIDKKKKDITVLDNIASISQRGMDAIPTSWQIPFYVGTEYYLFTKKYDPAKDYLKKAAEISGAPSGVALTYASFVSKSAKSSYATSRGLIDVIVNNTDNEIIKKLASSGLQEQLINQILEKGITAYKATYNRYPKTIEDMMVVHLVSLPDGFLDLFAVEINQYDGSFKVVEK